MNGNLQGVDTQLYRVTLTHKTKIDIHATSPDAALLSAQQKVEGILFVPSTFNVKEIMNNAD